MKSLCLLCIGLNAFCFTVASTRGEQEVQLDDDQIRARAQKSIDAFCTSANGFEISGKTTSAESYIGNEKWQTQSQFKMKTAGDGSRRHFQLKSRMLRGGKLASTVEQSSLFELGESVFNYRIYTPGNDAVGLTMVIGRIKEFGPGDIMYGIAGYGFGVSEIDHRLLSEVLPVDKATISRDDENACVVLSYSEPGAGTYAVSFQETDFAISRIEIKKGEDDTIATPARKKLGETFIGENEPKVSIEVIVSGFVFEDGFLNTCELDIAEQGKAGTGWKGEMRIEASSRTPVKDNKFGQLVPEGISPDAQCVILVDNDRDSTYEINAEGKVVRTGSKDAKPNPGVKNSID